MEWDAGTIDEIGRRDSVGEGGKVGGKDLVVACVDELAGGIHGEYGFVSTKLGDDVLVKERDRRNEVKGSTLMTTTPSSKPTATSFVSFRRARHQARSSA